jgi:hypothetical protein
MACLDCIGRNRRTARANTAGQVVDTHLGELNPSISEAACLGADDARTTRLRQGPFVGGPRPARAQAGWPASASLPGLRAAVAFGGSPKWTAGPFPAFNQVETHQARFDFGQHLGLRWSTVNGCERDQFGFGKRGFLCHLGNVASPEQGVCPQLDTRNIEVSGFPSGTGPHRIAVSCIGSRWPTGIQSLSAC